MAEPSTLAPASGPNPTYRLLGTIAAPAAVLAGIAAVWEAAKRHDILPITVPAPSEIAATFLVKWPDLLFHMGPTVLSAAIGAMLATLIALTLAVLAVVFRRAEGAVLTVGVIVDSIPLIALTPILMLWVGNGLPARIVIATIAPLFPLLVGSIQGLKAVDRNVSDLFHLLGASRGQRVRKLGIPTALPFMFAALKVAAPLSVLGALIAEWVNADRGLGIMMIYALFSFDVPLAWLTILTVCLLASAAYGLVAAAERIADALGLTARKAGIGNG